MKRTARFCVSAGCLLLLIALFFGGRSLIVSIRMPRCCIFTFDSHCSLQFQQEVRDFAQSIDLRLACEPALYCGQLKKQFPLIDSLQTELSSTGTLFIEVDMAQPVCRINEDIVIALPCIIGPVTSYDSACIERLPHLSIASDNLQSWSVPDLCSLARALPTTLAEHYAIELCNFPELILTNKQQPKMSLRVRADLFNADDIIKSGASVHALLDERGAFSGKKQRQWVADMRFLKQIVLKVN